MVGKTNVAGARLHAVIAVTYPSGSTCTCTDGTTTMKAKDTSGKALFNVSTGTWTVKSTDGTDTASKAVSITANGQVESVKLEYTWYLYHQGDQCVDVTGGWVKKGTGGSLTFNSNSMTLVANSYQNGTSASTKNKVNLSDKKTLYFKLKSATRYATGYPRIGVSTTQTPDSTSATDWAATKTLSESSSFTTVSLDVSSLTSTAGYYILFAGHNGDAGSATIEVQDIWGE